MGFSYNVGRGLSAGAPFAGERWRFVSNWPGVFVAGRRILIAASLALLLPETRAPTYLSLNNQIPATRENARFAARAS
jgi:hypothetical protein